MHSLCPASGKKLLVSRVDFDRVVVFVKGQCRNAAEMLIRELDK
jgi:hypothetical protein